MARAGDASKRFDQLEKTMSGLAKAMQDVTKRLDGLEKGFNKGTKATKEATRAAKKHVDVVRNLRNQGEALDNQNEKGVAMWKKYGRQLSVVRSRMLIVAFAARMLQKSIGSLLELTQKQFVSELKLESVLRSTGHAAKMSGTEIRKLANELANTSLISDDLIIDAATIGLTFTNIGRDVFPEVIKQAMNMSIIFGQDLKQSMIQVGKAINDPLTGMGALGRVGVTFSETQKDQIKGFMKINDLASAQGVILEELAKEMGGVSDRMNEAPLSDWQTGMKRISDAGEGVGAAFNALLGPVRALWLGVSRLVEEFDKFDAWYTGRNTEKEAKEKAALIKDQNDAFRDQLRLMKDFLPEGAVGKASEALSRQIALYKEGKISTDQFIKTLENLIQTSTTMAKEGGFKPPLSPGQLEAQKKLNKFMEKFRSKNFEDEANFQIEKAKLLGASLDHQQQIRDFYATKQMEKNQEHFNQLQSQMTAFGAQLLQNQSDQLNLEMNRDIEAAKNTREFKIAQKRGDTDTMERIEKEAAKKTYARRVKNFKQNQALAISNIIIDYLQGVAKEIGKFGFFALGTTGALLAASSAVAVATVMAQKPPAFAQGGDFVTSGPQMIQVGDNPGGRERVQVTPLSSPNIAGPQGGEIVVNVSGNVLTQDFVEGELAENIKEAVRRGTDFGIS